MSVQENGAEKPVLRNVVNRGGERFEIAVLWRNTNPESKTVFSGHIDLLGTGRREHVFGFVNDRRDGSGGKVITLTANYTDPSSGKMGYRQVAIGNVVNHRSDGKPVYFDTVVFNPIGPDGKNVEGAAPVSVYVTKDCDSDLHAKLGFAQARIDRPKRDAPSDSADNNSAPEVSAPDADDYYDDVPEPQRPRMHQ